MSDSANNMCVIFFSYRQRADRPFILLANRDEFYERPTASAAFWDDAPDVFAGRDLVKMGTWLGITKSGRFAAVTNYRDPSQPNGSLSRGKLVADFLTGEDSVEDYFRSIKKTANEFGGFNLLAGQFSAEDQTLAYFSNRTGEIRLLAPGLYGLSNSLLDTPWPKVARGKAALASVLNAAETNNNEFFEILNDRELAADAELPDTGIGHEREKLLSSIFIETPVYGTRCSTIVTAISDFTLSLEEVVYI